MSTNFRTDATLLANSFVLLAMVAGIFYFELSESEAVSYHDQRVAHRMEVVFHPEPPSKSPAFSFAADNPHSDIVAACPLPSDFYTKFFSAVLFVAQNNAKNYTRPFLSSRSRSTSFNIPHLSSGEDELFNLPEDVA